MADTETQKRERAKRAREFLDQMVERYPQCFTRDRDSIRPLAIGIQKPLRADLERDDAFKDTPGWLIRQALALYTRSPAYLEATIAGRPRVALDGSDAGEITEQAQTYAQERREEQRRRQAERKARQQRSKRPQQPTAEERKRRKLEALADKFNSR